MWIDEVVERITVLCGFERDVTADGELDPILRQVAEVIRFEIGMLVGFGNVGWNPSVAVDVELGPAVVPSDLALSPIRWQWKTDLETCREIL